MVKVKDDLTGKQFGRLIVIKQAEDYIKSNGKHEVQWLCKCNCSENKTIVVFGYNLKNGNTKSCGCIQKEIASNNCKLHNPRNEKCTNKKYNKYDLSGEYGIGYTSKNEKFYFDLEDYDLIKTYCWFFSNGGYVMAYDMDLKKIILLHRKIIKTEKDIDHINHKKFDNRKQNLREVNDSQNSMNLVTPKNNTSGIKGVCFNKNNEKWQAQIGLNNKRIHLGFFYSFEDATKARKEAEEKYYGEYSYDNSMKKEIL